MTNVFVRAASERIADGARRLLANELEGEELHQHFVRVDSLAMHFPIRTIAVKTQIAEALVARGLGPDLSPVAHTARSALFWGRMGSRASQDDEPAHRRRSTRF